MRHRVIIPKKVELELENAKPEHKARILAALAALSADPLAGQKLSGAYTGTYSYRVWPYRIIYKIKGREVLVLLIKISQK